MIAPVGVLMHIHPKPGQAKGAPRKSLIPIHAKLPRKVFQKCCAKLAKKLVVHVALVPIADLEDIDTKLYNKFTGSAQVVVQLYDVNVKQAKKK